MDGTGERWRGVVMLLKMIEGRQEGGRLGDMDGAERWKGRGYRCRVR